MKKSQIKIGETVAVLFIFFVLIIMGIIFWSRYSQSSLREQQEVDILSQAIKVAQTASFLPELQCSTLEVIKFSCFDLYKIQAMQFILNDNSNPAETEAARQHYFDSFGYANITVYSIYPESESWNIYDFTGGNFTGFVTTQIPIAVYNPITLRFSFGYINVAAYIRGRV